MTRLKAITFDVTNTLLKSRASIGQQYAAAAKVHNLDADPVALDKAFDTTWSQKKREMPDYGRHHGVTSREWWSDLVKRVFISAGHADTNPETLTKVSDTLWDQYMVGSICVVVVTSVRSSPTGLNRVHELQKTSGPEGLKWNQISYHEAVKVGAKHSDLVPILVRAEYNEAATGGGRGS